MKLLKNLFVGMILGISNVIPGVSAGTMAVVFGIYDDLIEAVSLKIEAIKRNWRFLVVLAVGMGLGIILFSNAIRYLFDNFNIATNFFFMGIVIGSCPMILHKAKGEKLKPKNILPFIITFALMIGMFLFSPAEASAVTTSLSVGNFFYLLLVGALSAFSMIIPGISGSFIMLTLGAYNTVITAVSDFNIPIMIPVAIGCIIGILGGAKLVSRLMAKHPQATYLAIFGLVLGSLLQLYPGFAFTWEGLVAAVVFVGGMAVSYFMGRGEPA